MSGGSLGCLSYASFLHTLDSEYGLRPALLAGLSGGSLIAPLFSSGLAVEEIYDILCRFSIRSLLNTRFRGIELFSYHKFERIIRGVLPVETFEELKIPTLIFATDVNKQRTAVLESGDLATAVTASCSVYPLLKPVEREGLLLSDGGFTTFYGAEHIRARGIESIVGVDVIGVNQGTAPRYLKSFYLSVNSAIESCNRYELEKYPVDIDIRLDAKSPTPRKFKDMKEDLIELGVGAAHKFQEQIKSLIEAD